MSVRKQRTRAGDLPPRIEVRNPAGSVTVVAVHGAEEVEVVVDALDDAAEQLLDRVDIDLSEPDRIGTPLRVRVSVPERRLLRTPSFAVRITTPPDAAARIAVASADVELRGRFARTRLTSASGGIAVDEATELELRTASGGGRIGTVHRAATVGSASGDVRLGRVDGALQARTASGDVSVEHAGGTTSISTASGEVTVGTAAGDALQVRTVSGDVSVGVAPGLRIWLDLSSVSGRMTSDLDEDAPGTGGPPDLTLTLRSVSGDLRIARATAAPQVPAV